MSISAIGGASSAYRASSGSLDAQKASIDAKIFDISTCTTTPPAEKATMLANLNARKASLEQQTKQLEKKSDPPPIRDGSTIHVIA